MRHWPDLGSWTDVALLKWPHDLTDLVGVSRTYNCM